jgi:hypothetical protein
VAKLHHACRLSMAQTNQSRELLGVSVRLIRALGLACVATALLSSLMPGLWELAWPMSRGARYTFTPTFPAQLWVFATLQALKPAGFIAGLFGLYLAATRRGFLLKVISALAVAGGVFYALVWTMIAVTGRDDAIYLGSRPIGSDAHTNGGMLFLWLLPIAIGFAALVARRIPRWQAVGNTRRCRWLPALRAIPAGPGADHRRRALAGAGVDRCRRCA